jgi:hypothetical protein
VKTKDLIRSYYTNMIDITSHIAFQPEENDSFILLKLTHDLMRKIHGRNAQRRKGEQKERRGELRNAREGYTVRL